MPPIYNMPSINNVTDPSLKLDLGLMITNQYLITNHLTIFQTIIDCKKVGHASNKADNTSNFSTNTAKKLAALTASILVNSSTLQCLVDSWLLRI